jgi:uncharacterized glyoxalase superfamily protein PhnB
MNCIAFLNHDDARVALDWLERGFGLERSSVHEGPNGSIAHAEMRYGDGVIMLGTAGRNDLGMRTARELGAVNQGIYVIVDDGSRGYTARDPEGDLWSFGMYRPE